jgi:hypothetical protein
LPSSSRKRSRQWIDCRRDGDASSPVSISVWGPACCAADHTEPLHATPRGATTAARALGVGNDYATVLQERNRQFDQDYWNDTQYHSPECRDGGELDLDPNHAFSS